MALSDEHWGLIVKAMNGANLHGPEEVFPWFKENWELLGDQKRVQMLVDKQRLATLKEQKAAQEESLCCIDEEIKKLEG
jgi:hypothetical protein